MLKSLEPRPVAIGILLRIFQSIIASIVPAEQEIRFLQLSPFG